MENQLIYGKKVNGKYYVRPINWAGGWKDVNGEILLSGGNTLFESDDKQECKNYIRSYNRNKYSRELSQLIVDHPLLEVIPMVEYEIVAGDDFDRWAGSIGKSKIREFIYDMEKEEAIVYKDKLNDEEIKEFLDDGYKFSKAIFVDIDLPNYDE
jgi:hypothetical protein